MTKKITTEYLIDSLLPNYVVANYPRLVDFLKVFFEYLETQNKSSYYQNNLFLQRDIREQDPEFFEYITHELGRLSSGRFEIDSKVLYDQVVKIWQSKGTEESLIFLLKAIYGDDENTKITYPRDSILRASDGIWNQERFVTVKTSFGSVASDVRAITLVINPNVKQEIEVIRVEFVDSDVVRFYFRTNVFLQVSLNQAIEVLDQNNITTYRGNIILSPSRIEVDDGGKDWSVGQLITFPGTEKNTIARVSEVDNLGSIKRVEILEYGYDNTLNETFIVSPYPLRPIGSAFDYEYDEFTKTHTLSIFDFTGGTIENVNGLFSGVAGDSYFLENYSSEIYNGFSVIQQRTQDLSTVESPDVSSDITLQQWFDSRATLRYVFSNQTSLKGDWTTNRGIISDNSIRLQDNFYYQIFSYVIESNKLRSEYQSTLDIVHAAGTKSFSTTSLQQFLDLDIGLISEVPFKWIYLDDIVETDDQYSATLIKYASDNTDGAIDSIDSFEFTKNTLDILTPQDETAFSVIKITNDSANIIDAPEKVIDKIDGDSVTPVDESPLLVFFKERFFTDAVIPEDDTQLTFIRVRELADDVTSGESVDNFSITKSLSDSASISNIIQVNEIRNLTIVDQVSPTESIADFSISKILVDTYSSADAVSANNFKTLSLTDEFITADAPPNITTEKLFNDSATSAESIDDKSIIKALTDEVQATQVDLSTFYNEEAYFAEDYAEEGIASDFDAVLT